MGGVNEWGDVVRGIEFSDHATGMVAGLGVEMMKSYGDKGTDAYQPTYLLL